MLVSGDAARVCNASDVLGALQRGFEAAGDAPRGIERHAQLVNLLVDAGEWTQGLLDAQFRKDGGRDEASPLVRLCGRLLLELGNEVVRSLMYRFDVVPSLPTLLLERLARLPLPKNVSMRVPEGYAYQALYPEAYARAASRLNGPFRVIGVRSIGTGLAGVVAAATRSGPPVTVRPVGLPFSRELRISSELAAGLTSEPRDARFAVVDEGPGWSGSSFLSVAAMLESHGVPSANIHFFPGHAGDPGPHASDEVRMRWRDYPRQLVTFDELFPVVGEAPYSLTSWMEPLIGRAQGPAEDVSSGAWRERLYTRRDRWPGVNVQLERRKFRVRTEQGAFVLEFAGLSRYGERALQMGRLLAESGFVPQVRGLRHGFTAHALLEGARPLSEDWPSEVSMRGEWLEKMARYLAFRAQAFREPADERGASLQQLLEMARFNAGEVLGQDSIPSWNRFEPELPSLTRDVQLIRVDGKLQSWEWLTTPDGRLWKTDAVHHWMGPTLIGCQDVLWDVAGLEFELELDAEDAGRLLHRVAELTGRAPSRGLLELYRRVYLAFRLGQDTLAARSVRAYAPDEAARLERQAGRYAQRLAQLLA